LKLLPGKLLETEAARGARYCC